MSSYGAFLSEYGLASVILPQETQELQICEIMWHFPTKRMDNSCTVPLHPRLKHQTAVKRTTQMKGILKMGFYIGPQMERKVCRGRLSKWLVWHRDAANAHVPMLAPTDQYTNSHILMHICMYVPFISLCKM